MPARTAPPEWPAGTTRQSERSVQENELHPKLPPLNWRAAPNDARLIVKITGRAQQIADRIGTEVPPQLLMDLTACHLNGCAIDLLGLLHGNDSDFVHDVWGIHRHIDRRTGVLGDCFLPRFAARGVA